MYAQSPEKIGRIMAAGAVVGYPITMLFEQFQWPYGCSAVCERRLWSIVRRGSQKREWAASCRRTSAGSFSDVAPHRLAAMLSQGAADAA